METIEQKLKILEEKRKTVEMGGGESRIKKQHESGKLTARERILKLLDEGSFVELDAFTEHRCIQFNMAETKAPGEGVVTGYGTINGRLVFIFAQDFTVMGGSLGEMHAQKICKIMDMAVKMGAPVIGLNDSGGARIQEGVDALKGYGDIFYRNTLASGVIPQISVILGPCAGGAVYSPALTDFIFMVSGISKMFITGPQVIKAVTGEDVSPEELGGAKTHNQTSGVAHFMSESEEECFEQIKKLLSFLPSNNLEDAPFKEPSDDAMKIIPELNQIVPNDPNKPYDMEEVVEELVDRDSFLEVQKDFARNIIVGFSRIGGQVVGVVANQPYHLAGCLDIDAADKASRFIRFCDCFNIPLLTLVDVPGFLPGSNQELGGIIRHGAKMLYAYSEATVPKITVILRKAYGGAYLAMCSRDLGADLVLAWPTAEIAVMGAEGAVDIIFRQEIEKALDFGAERERLLEQYRQEFYNPYQAAKRGYVDEVIDPRETRMKIAKALEVFWSKREEGKGKKHGNFPV